MSERPVVSTLTSCFHGEKYLPLFLEKMPEQKAFDRLEVVIDLNEPSAEELRLVRQFQERYPDHLRYTVQDKVVTYSASWNNCIRNSTGQYLAVWNIDHLRPEDSIEKQAARLDADPDIGIVHGKYMVVPRFGDTDGDVFRNYRPVENREATRRFIFGAFYMFRKSLVEKAGYVDEQFRSSADFDHTLRLSLHTRSAVVDGNLGYYYMANTGLSNNPNSRIDVENFVIRMRYGIYDKLWFHYLAASSDYDPATGSGTERLDTCLHVRAAVPGHAGAPLPHVVRSRVPAAPGVQGQEGEHIRPQGECSGLRGDVGHLGPRAGVEK